MVLSRILSRSDVLELIWETVPVDSPDPTEPRILIELSKLTHDLIDRSGRQALSIDPFSEVYKRKIIIDRPQIGSILKNKVVLVTGGEGFVGTNLIAKLQQFGVKRIVSVDLSTDWFEQVKIDTTETDRDVPVVYYCSDVRDTRSGIKKDLPNPSTARSEPLTQVARTSIKGESLDSIFAIERPQIVFHLAAERLPGLAETQVRQTVSTNILGCDNIIRLCEEYRVESCIFSSTGKASRYFTPDVYAASKKISEWLFSDNSQPRTCQYGIVRFTHVVENSPVSSDLDLRVANGIVSLHAPDRYIYTQNIEESVNLLLNALTVVKIGQTKILAVRDIGWPINTLDLALYKILRSGRDIPIYFKGLPAGYESHVFLGQLDLSGDREILPMLNVLEADISEISQAGDMVISETIPFEPDILERSISNIKAVITSTDTKIKQTVIDSQKEIVLSSFMRANPLRLLDILKWGVSGAEKSAGGVDLSYDREIVALLLKGVNIDRCQREAELDLLQSLHPVVSASIQSIEQRCSGDPIQLKKKYRASKISSKAKKI
jgi:dTDP-4-dehydrorhamnose reductase